MAGAEQRLRCLKNSDIKKSTGRLPTITPELDHLPETILDELRAGLFVCDASKRGFPIVRISDSFTSVTGYTERDAVGENLALLYGTRTDAATVKTINQALR